MEVMCEACDTPAERREPERARLADGFASEQEHGTTATFIALRDGRRLEDPT
jgi:hypothetical protein